MKQCQWTYHTIHNYYLLQASFILLYRGTATWAFFGYHLCKLFWHGFFIHSLVEAPIINPLRDLLARCRKVSLKTTAITYGSQYIYRCHSRLQWMCTRSKMSSHTWSKFPHQQHHHAARFDHSLEDCDTKSACHSLPHMTLQQLVEISLALRCPLRVFAGRTMDQDELCNGALDKCKTDSDSTESDKTNGVSNNSTQIRVNNPCYIVHNMIQ